jgi:hypothetical protein
VREDELGLVLEQIEDGSECRLVLDWVVLQRQSTEENGKDLRKSKSQNGSAKQSSSCVLTASRGMAAGFLTIIRATQPTALSLALS